MEKSVYRAMIGYDFKQKATLCALVKWGGSVPRKDYPMMLVTESGTIIGTVGGGRLEHSVIETAKEVIATGKTIYLTLDLTGKDATGDTGICGGWAEVLIEPFTPSIRKHFRQGKLLQILEDPAIQLTVVNMEKQPIAQRCWFALGEEAADKAMKEYAAFDASLNFINVFMHKFHSSPTLHIFGAGHIAKATAELAAFVEIETIIYDDRADLATKKRFPKAIELVTDPLDSSNYFDRIHPNDFLVVATHGHANDLQMMTFLLQRPYAYLGLVSSKNKWGLLSEELRSQGFSDSLLNAVHTPVGLDIGAETVPQIAVSIIAEIIQQRHHKSFPSHLRV